MAIRLDKINDDYGVVMSYHRIIDMHVDKDGNELRITLKEYLDSDTRKEKDGIIKVITITDKLTIDKFIEYGYTVLNNTTYKGGEKV